jgi:Patatin-like phospholipase
METNNNSPFEIGLVMAGAVSAGAYTAGVMDYLLEALDTWQKEKDKGNATVPQHNILIKVMTGASAGGMTTAITVAELLRDKTPACRSYMYQAWVKEIDITKLLGTKDLAASDGIRSLFDATAIDAIANEVIHAEHPPKWKSIPYIDPELKLYLTLSNLRGLPYEFKLKGQTGFPYGMTDHSDYQYIEISEKTTQADWTKLRNAAIATGAFPVGLASRLIKRDTDEYKTRIAKDGRDISGLMKLDTNQNQPYHFVAVDGGTLNNEPLELARSVWEKFTEEEKATITSYQKLEEARAAMRARVDAKGYALVLIDPFPDLTDMGKNATEKDTGLLNILGPIVGALRAQSLFKMEELLRAGDSENKESYLVAPIRYTDTNTKALNAIACGFFGGFGGFLAEEFREHDYHLGRRNCQRFLDRYFVLTEEEAKQKGWPINEKYIFEQNSERCYPIIPIIKESETAKPQGEKNLWPSYKKMRANNLKDGLTVRVRSVMQHMLPFGWIGQKWVSWALIILPLLIIAGEFVKAELVANNSPAWLGGLNNTYILLFQIILLLAFVACSCCVWASEPLKEK